VPEQQQQAEQVPDAIAAQTRASHQCVPLIDWSERWCAPAAATMQAGRRCRTFSWCPLCAGA
jgi:hypothetical protein